MESYAGGDAKASGKIALVAVGIALVGFTIIALTHGHPAPAGQHMSTGGTAGLILAASGTVGAAGFGGFGGLRYLDKLDEQKRASRRALYNN